MVTTPLPVVEFFLNSQGLQTQTARVVLPPGMVYRLPRQVRKVSTVSGCAWMTTRGQDIILNSGSEFVLSSGNEGKTENKGNNNSTLISAEGEQSLVLEIQG